MLPYEDWEYSSKVTCINAAHPCLLEHLWCAKCTNVFPYGSVSLRRHHGQKKETKEKMNVKNTTVVWVAL